MKKIFVKYKILINGFNIIGDYEIDGFILREDKINEENFKMNYDVEKTGINYNLNIYLYSCITDRDLKYRYMESANLMEIDVSNKTQVTRENLLNIIEKYKEITEKIYDLEKKIRLIFNIPVLFQIINIEFYNENKKYIGFTQLNKPISMWNRCTYNLNPIEFSNNSRFGMNFDAMKNTKNNHFNRALEFYNDSFDSEKISNRFILIFSSLEAIFNLDSGDVTEKISKYTAKLLAENNIELYDRIYHDIKKLYQKRCVYIHGGKINNISDLDEKLLRKYVRKIIIAYWMIIINTGKTAKEILKYLDSDEKLDIQVRLMISALNSNSFSEQQSKSINIVEDELNMQIPDQTKKNLLKNCNQ